MECNSCSKILKSWLTDYKDSCGASQSLPIELGTLESHTSSFLLRLHKGKTKIEWILATYPIWDLTPVLTTFQDHCYFNPFSCAQSSILLLNELSNKVPLPIIDYEEVNFIQLIELVSIEIMKAVDKDQQIALNRVKLDYPALQLELDSIAHISDYRITLCQAVDCYTVYIEFHPSNLLGKVHYSNEVSSFLEHAAVSTDPIVFTRVLRLSKIGNDIANKYGDRIHIPPNIFSCSANIEFDGVTVNGNMRRMHLSECFPSRILGKLSAFLSPLALKWTLRKRFIEELSRVATVLEFDAIDFSFVVIAVRMKHGQLCTICTADFRLTANFPDKLPLISVYDMQSSTSTVVDFSSKLGEASDVAAGNLADECLSITIRFIQDQAFGT